ncbi:MAG: hypothetical protein MJ197_03635 [Bacteroidales bacterium]|nr:hypothetical protein [Bacteroidales bacterium]
MKITNPKNDFVISSCPVCGTSWSGQSYLYIYQSILPQFLDAPFTREELEQYIQKRHKSSNQSRLIFDEMNEDYICPDCHTHFQLVHKI